MPSRGIFNIKNGLTSTSDLLASGPRFAASGRGTVNLSQNSLNLTVVLDLKTKNMLPVTANLSGPFNDLKWKIDAAGLLQEAGKNPGGLADRLGWARVKAKPPPPFRATNWKSSCRTG